MLLNAFWVTHEDRVIHDLADRSCSIDNIDRSFAECAVYGRRGIHDESLNASPALLRESCGDFDRIIAITDLPFSVEFWNTDSEERFTLNWEDGIWSTGDAMDFTDEELWLDLKTIDVESLVAKAVWNLGLTHITGSNIRDRKITIELVDRQDWSEHGLEQGAYYYRDTDDSNINFTNDVKTLPNVAELEMLHHVDESSTKHDYIKIFYDDDIPADVALERMRPRNSNIDLYFLTTLDSESSDIVDMLEEAKVDARHAHIVSYFYIVKSDTGIQRLYINMDLFQPNESPYLS